MTRTVIADPDSVSARPLTPADPELAFEPIPVPTTASPQLFMVVDTEEEFDWTKPFSPHATEITNIRHQHLAHRIFERYGVVPTYAVDFPVADHREAVEPLRDFLSGNLCEIGAQLHPWVTPPHNETVCERNSFPGRQ